VETYLWPIGASVKSLEEPDDSTLQERGNTGRDAPGDSFLYHLR